MRIIRQLQQSPYIRLMRLHQPVGIWLLLWPCWWSVVLASHGHPLPHILVLFALGAILMRSAGCIINDIADRNYDRQVERTRTRPLASGELSLTQAVVLLIILLAASGFIALLLGKMAVVWAIFSLVPVAMYPFMKRITWWPQFFLGLTFNWGALMGWSVVRGTIGIPAIFLYIGCVFWTLGYDTIYAHQDKEDDARIGVKSTALRLGDNSMRALKVFYLMSCMFWALAGMLAGFGLWFYIILIVAEAQLGQQIQTVKLDDPESCRRVFVSNARLGCIVFIALVAGRI